MFDCVLHVFDSVSSLLCRQLCFGSISRLLSKFSHYIFENSLCASVVGYEISHVGDVCSRNLVCLFFLDFGFNLYDSQRVHG